MQKIRCLVADIPHIILADIVQQIAEDSSAIDIVNRDNSIKNVFQSIQEHAADVVILGVDSNTLPGDYMEMLDAFPGLVMVGIVGNGRRAIVIVDDVGPQELSDLIQTSTKGRKTD